MEQFADTTQLVQDIRTYMIKHGTRNLAKVLREVVFVHVGWDSEFTELDNVLRKIERNFKGETREVTDIDRAANAYTEDKLGIPNLPDGDPADHFS